MAYEVVCNFLIFVYSLNAFEEEKEMAATKEKNIAEKKTVRLARKALAKVFKSRPRDIDGIANPLTAEDKKTKRAFVVAIALEVHSVATKSKLNEDATNQLMVEAVAGSGILYKRDSKFKEEAVNAEGEASAYAGYGSKEMEGDNSYYKKYQTNVEACRKFSKALVRSVIQKQKEMQ